MATVDDPVPGGSQQLTTTPATPAAEPPASTGIQPGEGAGQPPASIPLPPIPAPPATVAPAVRARVRFLDGTLFVLLLVFAFLCASFKAINTDLFMHLATGRLIAQGSYKFGSDPFTFTSQGTWVNNAWLFDLGAYAVHSIPHIGAAALIVLKALLTAATAWLIFRAGSLPGRRAWIPLACTFLAVLALSPRLHLQSAVVSIFLLALVLFLLLRPAGRAIWLVPVVCLFWVNLDAWFLLGPLTVLLFVAGELLQRRQGQPPPRGGAAATAAAGAALQRGGVPGQPVPRPGVHRPAHRVAPSGQPGGPRQRA